MNNIKISEGNALTKREELLQLIDKKCEAGLLHPEDEFGKYDLMFEVITGEPYDPSHEMADIYEFLLYYVACNKDQSFVKAYHHGERWWLKA